MIKRTLKNEALLEGEQDAFIADGRMEPDKWFEDVREMKNDAGDDSPKKDLHSIRESYH